MTKVLLISVKPEFASKILCGEKQIELRKSSPDISPGDTVIIYSTQPEKAVLGSCVVKEVIRHSPDYLWRKYSSKLGIDRKRYFEYFDRCEVAVGIVFSAFNRYDNKIPLDSIRKAFPGFSPPQTFKYLSRNQQQWVQFAILGHSF